MRGIVLFFFCLGIMNLQAQEAEKGFSFTFKQKDLKEIIREIEKQSEYSFVYSETLNLSVKRNLTIKNKSIFDVLSAVFEKTDIEWKISGKHIILRKKENVVEEKKEAGFGSSQKLEEVIITGNSKAQQLVESSQMGTLALTQMEIKNIPTIFGEADVIKAIQTQPGVSAGTEALAGMYVRGGIGDDNLFILDGNPLYQVNHLGGLFSIFNTEAINDVTFYKSSFPARYGGRLSSVLDVRTKDGNLEEYHGSAMLGLTSGNLNINGPIFKGKTGFNLSVRRSWFELLSVPGIWYLNKRDEADGIGKIGAYAFTDLNFKVNHHFSPKSKLYLNVYYGNDYLKFGNKQFSPGNEKSYQNKQETRLNWGNMLLSTGWNYQFNERLYLDASLYHIRYASNISYLTHDESGDLAWDTYEKTIGKSRTENGINDTGIRFNFNYYPNKNHRINFGVNAIYHYFRPEYHRNYTLKNSEESEFESAKEKVYANELGVYAEDEWKISSRISLNAGLRFGMFHIDDQQHTTLEPRITSRWLIHPDFSLKLSYSRMYQYVQQISGNYISLPSDYWMPIFGEFKPLKSDQFSAGLYYNLGDNYSISLEGYYKQMDNLLEYKENYDVFSRSVSWKEKLTSGEGRSYGTDILITKERGRLTGYLGYGLMWADRRFEEINGGKTYPAKYDNRHKINLVVNYKLNENVEVNGSWTFMTGNRLTLAFDHYQDLEQAGFPSGLAPLDPYKNWIGLEYFEGKNNYRLPAYHRLDLGINFYRPKANNRMGIWSISLYNAYSRMNPIAVTKDWYHDYPYSGSSINSYYQTVSLLPIIPSVSYTYKF